MRPLWYPRVHECVDAVVRLLLWMNPQIPIVSRGMSLGGGESSQDSPERGRPVYISIHSILSCDMGAIGDRWGVTLKPSFPSAILYRSVSKLRCHSAFISVRVGSPWSHWDFKIKRPALCTEYLTRNISLCSWICNGEATGEQSGSNRGLIGEQPGSDWGVVEEWWGGNTGSA